MQCSRVRMAVVAAALLLAPGVAIAQVPDAPATVQARQQRRDARRERLRQRFEARFQRMDRNNDGLISRDEWSRRPRAFDRIDVNHDGALTQAELKSAVARAIRRHMRQRRAR